ncbi:MAG: OmpA family protein [Gallionellaceae bacterium]
MTPFAALVIFIGVCLFGGQSETTVILLPDENGKVGAVTVKTADDFKVIDQAYHAVTAGGGGAADLSEVQEIGEVQVNKEYAQLLQAQPVKPSSFLLYFVTGTSNLTEASVAMLPQVIAKIKEQAVTEISIIGHTDATGSDEINNKLSLERAMSVEKLLQDSMPSQSKVEVKSFGSKDPLVPAPANVSEPKNRRVEILIL